jgi:hypothetical protein
MPTCHTDTGLKHFSLPLLPQTTTSSEDDRMFGSWIPFWTSYSQDGISFIILQVYEFSKEATYHIFLRCHVIEKIDRQQFSYIFCITWI